MKKIYILSSLILWLFLIVLSTFEAQAQSSSFVTLQGKQFKLEGQDFYPISMNYGVEIVHDDNEGYYIAPAAHYRAVDPGYDCSNPADCFQEILDDLNTIRGMGFNSIRLVGLGFGSVRPWNWQALGLNWTTYPAFISYNHQLGNLQIIPVTAPYNNMFSLIESALNAAAQADLKVQLLVGGKKIDDQTFRAPYLAYLQSIASHFSTNSTLYSYDFKNEPLYFDNGNYSKGDVCSLVEDWHLAIKNNSTQHLTTLGLATSSEVGEWDPGVLKLDFLSFHLYSDILNVVKSEIKWISETSRLPWIIGETGFPASNDNEIPSGWGSLQDQRGFAKATLEMVRDCGGSGYSWWQYSDVEWEPGFGLIHRNNILKPANLEFNTFDPNIQGGSCITPPNYYNFYGYSNYSISGIVKNQNNQPIKNAVITGWDANWQNSVRTYSQSNGQFTLYSNNPINIVFTTAVGASIYKNYSSSGYLNVSINQFQPDHDITVNNTTVQSGQSQNYEASNSINSSNVTIVGNGSTGGNCSMKATQIVRLNTGFSAQKGSRFHAYNAPVYADCNYTSNYLKRAIKEEQNPPQSKSPKLDFFAPPFDINSSTEEVFKFNSVLVYPNPSSGVFNVVSDDNLTLEKVEVYNSLGQKIHEVIEGSTHNLIDISGNVKGIYLLKVYKGGEVQSSTIIYK